MASLAEFPFFEQPLLDENSSSDDDDDLEDIVACTLMTELTGVAKVIPATSPKRVGAFQFRLNGETPTVPGQNLPPPPRSPRHRQRGYVGEIVSTFRMDEFKTFFRVSRVTVQCLKEWICRVCMEKDISGITERRGTGGSVQKPLEDRLLVMLWFMASQDKYASIGDRFGMSESTASYAIRNLLFFISENLVDKCITWPTADELQEIQDMYEQLKHFPGVVGMIDGCHIPIRRPKDRGIDYFNRKEYYSVVLQAVVREDMRFIHVHTGWPGKVHDARAFGIYKGRFPRLHYIYQRDIHTIIATIQTGCVLHNICIMNDDKVEEVFMDDPIPQCQANVHNYCPRAQEAGAQKRLAIARRLSVN